MKGQKEKNSIFPQNFNKKKNYQKLLKFNDDPNIELEMMKLESIIGDFRRELGSYVPHFMYTPRNTQAPTRTPTQDKTTQLNPEQRRQPTGNTQDRSGTHHVRQVNQRSYQAIDSFSFFQNLPVDPRSSCEKGPYNTQHPSRSISKLFLHCISKHAPSVIKVDYDTAADAL